MPLDGYILEVFLVFCRVGACLMIVPGLASARVPVRVRLYISLALSAVIAPVVGPGDAGAAAGTGGLLRSLAVEVLAGLTVGAVTRLSIEAMEFAGASISNYVGLSWVSGSLDGGEPQPAIATLVAATATLLLMLMDLPQHIVTSVVHSYAELPRGVMPDTGALLHRVSSTLAAAFMLAIQVSAPFLIYGLVLNAMFGILGKLVPQMPAFFISMPFIAFGSLLLIYLLAGQLFHVLTSGLSALLAM